MKAILDFYPDAANITQDEYGDTNNGFDVVGKSYPLHAACWEDDCPLSVIELLVEKNPSALSQLGTYAHGLPCCPAYAENTEYMHADYSFSFVQGTPLQYYLSRGNYWWNPNWEDWEGNMSIEGVKLLVEACPEALQVKDPKKRTNSLHTIAVHPELSAHYDIVEYLVNFDPTMMRGVDCYDANPYNGDLGSIPLNLVCGNNNASIEIVKFLVERWPSSIRERDHDGCLPIHNICQNGGSAAPLSKPRGGMDDATALEIAKFLVDEDPSTLHEAHSQGWLPIHFAAGEGHRGRAFCEFLVNQYPESVRRACFNGFLPSASVLVGASVQVTKLVWV